MQGRGPLDSSYSAVSWNTRPSASGRRASRMLIFVGVPIIEFGFRLGDD